MNDKIYRQLPEYLQTTANRNFFEVTVEQLFSQANTETFKGLIGTQRSSDYNAEGSFIRENTATRHHYSLTPVVNTINSTTGDPDNYVFFDEFIDTLDTYSVDVTNQNRLFGSDYQTFLPPVDVDKLINFQEYYWVVNGPTPIQIVGTLENPINIDLDVIGKKNFTPEGGIPFKNGMIVRFTGEYVIPTSKAETNYIIQGVGESIVLVPLNQNYSTPFSTPELNNWDATPFSILDANIVHTAGNITSVIIENAGVGYLSPTVAFTGANTTLATATANANVTTGAIDDVTLTSGGYEYAAPVGIILTDIDTSHLIDVANTVVDGNGVPVTNVIVSLDTLVLDSVSNVLVGQQVTHANFTSRVGSISGTNVTLTETINIDSTIDANVSFSGVDFVASVRTDMATFTTAGNGQITVTGVSSAAFAGQDPNTGDYYLQGGEFSWDKDGELSWGGQNIQEVPDYITIGRGAENKNVWSRVNFWFHRDNFLDAGDDLPDRTLRADRPILEYDRCLEMFNSGNTSVGTVSLASIDMQWAEVDGKPASLLVDDSPVIAGTTIIFPNETLDVSQYVWIVSIDAGTNTVVLNRIGDPGTNPAGFEDGDTGFIPFTFAPGEQIQITSGSKGLGQEWYWVDGEGLILTQFKTSINQTPLFSLYDDEKQDLSDTTLFPNTSFAGSRIFGFAENPTGTNDSVYGFPLSYKPFKSSSEIEYENFIDTERVTYQVFGDTETTEVDGYYYYKLTKDIPEYHSYWKNSNQLNEQTIDTFYYINRFDVSTKRVRFYIGCEPNVDSLNASGYDITILVNADENTSFTYIGQGFIEFDAFDFELNDVIEIKARSREGLLIKNSISKYELPLSWFANTLNEEIDTIAEPEYLAQFVGFMENQDGFTGDPTSSNNFTNTAKETRFANQIVKTDQDLILGAYLADQQPHNIIDALRFNGAEYEKYKNRFRSELTKYYNTTDTSSLTNEQILEAVLRRLISFSVGKEVFNRTYVVPYGDNFTRESFTVISGTSTFVLTAYEDLDKIENSLLVYHVRDGVQTLLTIGADYTISAFNPITIAIDSSYTLLDGDVIITKLYNDQRDSAQCPPTPSTMGLYPLYQPMIEADASFQTPINLLTGHDGSKITLFGDDRDNIMLEFEIRIFNAAKAEFRAANSIPDLSLLDVRSGAFRSTNFDTLEWFDLLRTSFSNWAIKNKVDPIVNEHYDAANEFTWNYRGTGIIPGHWRGWYTYYYDTVRPNTHPWEMLGFFEQPSWWTTQYGTDYGSDNTAMWSDLELGIIRQGDRENLTDDVYLTDNPFRRIGLSSVLPVDANADLISPYQITSTGATTRTIAWTNTDVDISAGIVTSSYLNTDGLNISYDVSNVYVESAGLVNHDYGSTTDENGELILVEQELTYNIPRVNLMTVTSSATAMPDAVIGVTVNGLPLYSPNQNSSWEDGDVWHYNSAKDTSTVENGHVTDDGLFYYYIPVPEIVGLTDWDTANHSPIVGWAFDGLPIYGPYGYSSYEANGQISDNTITNIKSAFQLKTGTREESTGPGGAYTGAFVEDYEYNAALITTPGHAGKWNQRYGVTPDSPSTPIRFYVATMDDSGNPMFPYAVGGGSKSGSATYAGEFFTTPQDISNNSTNAGYVDTAATDAVTSVSSVVLDSEDSISGSWVFGDGAPVENAWRYSEAYPYAVAEALFLSKPGKFATVFADPTQLVRPGANPTTQVDKTTRRTWKFYDSTNFSIHGDFDDDDNFITNIGYTPFIHTWLQFQGLNTVTNFVEPLRTLNSRLGYRFAGFIDKDTMTVRTDQFSTTGDATSLIIPQENINVAVHTSPYKTRNFYSGVIIEKTANGYKVRGYDKNYTYFNTTESKTTGRRQEIERGGSPAKFVVWKPNTTFASGTIVKVGNIFYQNLQTVRTGSTFDSSEWVRLASLPQVNAAKGVFYQDTTGNTLRVDYETEYTTIQEVFDFLINLGKYQQNQGYAFGEYDTSINSVRNWLYAAEQFLFWTTGKWEIGNTLELSPMATKVRFNAPRGFVAEVKRTDRNQYTLLDQNGAAISIKDCEVFREDTTIEIIPPVGTQIYACLLHTIEVEHAMTIDNTTDFNDTIFNSLLNQRQPRLRVKATRTAGWDGRFSSQGFIIQGDELAPNLDNQAESLGRYHELGYVPVEKDIYRSARALFGFEDRAYLRDLDIVDDDQFEFYKGMIQNKGTNTSLSRIAKSSAVIQGDVTIYDEWALKVGEFGDVENEQSVELKLERSDVIQDPQLVTLAFPEDTTGYVEGVEILYKRHEYYTTPSIEISAPTSATGTQATAGATIGADGKLSSIVVTNGGSGYTELVGLNVIAGNTVVQAQDLEFDQVFALSDALFTDANIVGIANITIIDHFAANVSPQTIDLSGLTDAANVVSAINLNATTNANVTAEAIISHGNANINSYVLQVNGPDFTLGGSGLANLNLTAARYQPRQRYAIEVANNTTTSNILVSVDNVTVPYSGGTNWEYDAGDRWTITTSTTVDPGGSLTVTLNTGEENGTTSFASENLSAIDGEYPYIDVYVNGVLITNPGYETRYRPSSTTQITFDNISLLPDAALSERINSITGQSEFVLASGAKIKVIERATIDFTDAYQGDLPGSTLNIKVFTNDGIAIKVGSKRIYEITPDVKNDEVILIDIDDTSRFLKKPVGVREHNLWPVTSSVDFRGLTDSTYQRVPNAGYVKPSVVDYQSYDIQNIPALFGTNRILKPSENDLVHIASSENKDWNVYKLKDIGANVSFVEQSDGVETAYLFSDRTLFDFVDSNQLQEDDLGRYLDYHLVVKKTSLSDNLVVWANEQVVNKKSVKVSNFGAITMIQANVSTGGPIAESVYEITNIAPATASSSSGTATAASNTSTVTVTYNTGSIVAGETVRFLTTDYTDYTFDANITHNSYGNITVDSANIIFVKEGRPVSLSFDVDTEGATNHLYYPSNISYTGNGAGSFDIVTSDILQFQNFFGNTTVSNLTSVSYSVTDQSNLHGQIHTVSNVDVANSTFTVTQGNVTDAVDTSNLIIEFQQLCEVTSNAHNLYAGEVIKVFANNVTGFYMIEAVTDDKFVINAPYRTGQSTTGQFITRGVEFVTSEEHGLDADYAGKRIAIHNADNPFYNKVYTVSSVVDANTVICLNEFAYTTSANSIANAVMTTLDHDVIRLNNTSIKVDNLNSPEAVADAINRTMALRRALISSDQMNIDMMMLRGIRDQYGSTKNQVVGATPWVTDFTDDMLDGLAITGEMRISQVLNENTGFNRNRTSYDIYKNGEDTEALAAIDASPYNTYVPGTNVSSNRLNLSNTGRTNIATVPMVAPVQQNDLSPTDVNPVMNFNNQAPVMNPSILMAAPIAPCGPLAAPRCKTPVPPTPRRIEKVPGECYGADTDIVPGITGNGNGSRAWLGVDSGYYQQTTDNDRDVSFVGATHYNHGLEGKGLVGAQTWSDNGSTNTFNMSVQFNKVGTFYVHVNGYMRSNFSSTTYVDISGADSGNGRVYARWSGQMYKLPRIGNVREIVVSTPGQQVTFAASTTGGGNHWNSIRVEVSAQADAVRSCALPTTLPGTTAALQRSASSEQDSEYYTNRNANRGGTESFSFHVPTGGKCTLLFDHYGGADGIEIFQGHSLGAENRFITESKAPFLRKLTAAEKGELRSRFGRDGANVRDYEQAEAPSSRVTGDFIGVKYGGAMDFVVDAANGTYLRIMVNKEDDIFSHILKTPKITQGIVASQDPDPTRPCGTTFHSPNTGNPTPAPTGAATPIITPAGSETTQRYAEGYEGDFDYDGRGVIGSYGASYLHNFGGFGRPPMSGFSFIPDIFKKTVKVTQSASYGVPTPLASGRYVNNTVQRISGGRVIPLASPISTPIPASAQLINTIDAKIYPHFNGFNLPSEQFLDRNGVKYAYSPDKIGTSLRLSDGSIIQNATDTQAGFVAVSPDTYVITSPSGIPSIIDNTSASTAATAPSSTVPLSDAPVDTTVNYEQENWVFTITGLDENGNPAGPAAPCHVHRPRPSIVIDTRQVQVNPGDGIFINGTEVSFPDTSPTAIKHSLECAGIGSNENGSNFEVTDVGNDQLMISACGNVPLTIKEGCRGGVYKEVLDFHVVRGFDQSITQTSNATVIPTTSGFYNGANVSAVHPVAVYTRYDVDGVSEGTVPQNSQTNQGSVLTTVTTSRSTGGSGYTVGDRLRVVGGVPVTQATANIAGVCVDFPGYGYTSASNVQVIIGDGSTPGRNAVVGGVTLDENNGIASVTLDSVGDGYDPARPPKIRIIDLGAGKLTSTPWVANTTYSKGAIISYQGDYFEALVDLETGPTFDTNNMIPKNQLFNPVSAEISIKFEEESVPARVAKFEVVEVDANGTIAALRILDRGIYKVFPSDLTTGIPLEYDGIRQGNENTKLGKIDPLNNDAVLGTPGAYDPARGKYFDGEGEIAGGTGARVFLTAREIPDCSEKGTAKAAMGLPDIVGSTNIPEYMASLINTGLTNANYDPNDLRAEYVPINDKIGRTRIASPGFAGIRIDELTPGLLDKLGLPWGDFNVGALCLQATIETSELDDNQVVAKANELADEVGLGLVTDGATDLLVLTCIDNFGGSTSTNGQDPNSIFGDANVTFINDLFQYELRTIYGEPVTAGQLSQECQALYFESQRYDTEANLTLSSFSNVWIDNYNNTGWAYLENGSVIEQQSSLVDTNFLKNVILYDEITGDKKYDLDVYDPFKGVLPGFIEKEITFVSEHDPVVYNSARARFGAKDIGKVWWNTSTIRYNWYEQGTNRERWLNWGSAFPGSVISLYEWTESDTLPSEYTGTGTPINYSQYITERTFNEDTENYITKYYFWVQNKTDLVSEAVNVLGRQIDTFTLAKYMADPAGYGLNLVNFIADDSFTMNNIGQILDSDEDIIQINFSRDLNPDGLKHTSWLLSRKGDDVTIPGDLSNKMIDSLCAVDAVGNPVPDPLLSEVEAYGEKFRPRQTMFKNVKEARRLMTYIINQNFLDLKMNTEFNNWDDNLPTNRTYIETVNWYAVRRIDPVTQEKVRYDASFKPIYNVSNISELSRLSDLDDGTVVQLRANETDRFHLYIYDAASSSFELIAIENETVRLKSTVYTDDTNDTLSTEIREILNIFKDNVVRDPTLWNTMFFDLLEHAFVEQRQLSWAFKTSYLYAEKQESDLIEINGFKPDNFEKVIEYMNEVKPYTSKIREYKDGKVAPMELFTTNSLSDYDKPPYYDPVTGEVRILDDFDIDDYNIMANLAVYNDYLSIANKGQVPFRSIKSSLVFDRTNWDLTAFNWDPTAETSNSSIATNIAYLVNNDASTISADTNMRSVDRIFKFDPTVQAQFASEMEIYLTGIGYASGSGSNTTLTGNADILLTAINAGGLDTTLALAKVNVGGDWMGEVWDANLFTKVVEGYDGTTDYQDVFAYDTDGWAETPWDFEIQVINVEGTFDETQVNFRRDGVLYQGVDGWTFQQMLYGEERPEELIMLEPLESLIITVKTEPSAYQHPSDNTFIIYETVDGNIVSNVSANASAVDFRMHQDLFGGTEFHSLSRDGTANTVLTSNVTIYDNELTVSDGNVLTRPELGIPGLAWIGTELISYTIKSGNTISNLERGVNGTTIKDWSTGDTVYPVEDIYNFTSLTKVNDSNVWLDVGAVSLADRGNANISDTNSIMKFLHGL